MLLGPYRAGRIVRKAEDRDSGGRRRSSSGVSVRISRIDLKHQKQLRIEQGRADAREPRRRGRGRSSGPNDSVEESSKIADAKREYRKGNRFLDVGRGL